MDFPARINTVRYTAPVLITAPQALPVSCDEAKRHLRVYDDADDALISGMIDAAVSWIDGWSGILGRALITQQWRFTLSRFPRSGIIRLPMPPAPMESPVVVSYLPCSDDQATILSGISIHAGPGGFYILLTSGAPLPATPETDAAVIVDMWAGFGSDGASVPAAIRHAILLYVAWLYDNRGSQNLGSHPSTIAALLAPFAPGAL